MPTYNASDERQVKKARRKAAQAQAIKHDVVRKVMSSAPGRAWIYEMLDACHIYHTPFMVGNPDGTAFNLGEHNRGLALLADVQAAAPDLYLQMIQEAKNSSNTETT